MRFATYELAGAVRAGVIDGPADAPLICPLPPAVTVLELVQAGLPQDGPAPSPTERRGLIEETTRSHAG